MKGEKNDKSNHKPIKKWENNNNINSNNNSNNLI